jgi:CheY-like chemotaxis protein
MDDLEVNSQFNTIFSNDKDADAATTIVESLSKAGEEVALVEDGETLLDIAALGHGDNTAILADVKNTVLLEDRTKHVLNDDRWRWVGDEARLLMELLGEEVNTEVTVLASLRGGGDTDDLARTALKNQEIANADVVAGDGDGVRRSHGAR